MNNINLSAIKLPESKHYNPIVQLLSIFPKTSIDLIPCEYRELMKSESNISDYYPTDYQIDTYYKRYFWQCEPILPLIDYDRINSAVRKIKMPQYLKTKFDSDIFIK